MNRDRQGAPRKRSGPPPRIKGRARFRFEESFYQNPYPECIWLNFLDLEDFESCFNRSFSSSFMACASHYSFFAMAAARFSSLSSPRHPIFGYDAIAMFVKDLAVNVRDSCQQMVQGSPSGSNGFDEGEAPQAVFNVLDGIIKSTLDRLKTVRYTGCHNQYDLIRRITEISLMDEHQDSAVLFAVRANQVVRKGLSRLLQFQQKTRLKVSLMVVAK